MYENEDLRGVQIVLFNRKIGTVVFAKAFDTFYRSDGFDKFIQTKLEDNLIIIAACKDDCVKNMSEKGKQWFSDLGSKEIWNFKYR